MFCSPRPSRTNESKLQTNTSVNVISLRNKQNVTVNTCTPVINRKMNERISVQLTPFHTPNVPSKVRSARLFSNNQSNVGHITSAPVVYNKLVTNNNGININSESPLLQQSKSEQNLSTQSHVLPIVNKPTKRNVFSRLTNPKHFTATSRTRAQELQALKHKIRKQKDSHTQIQQKRVDWFAQLPNTNEHGLDDHAHLTEDENHKTNPSVFRRLHKTRIRNSRPNLNNSMNSNGDESLDQNDSGILLEPSRVIYNQEITKKAIRNNVSTKSMLMAPIRVLTPDDDEL